MAAASLPKNKVMYGLDASKYPSRMGKPWKKDEVEKLLTSIQEKKSIETIAKEHDRTEGGIKSYLRKLAVDYHLKFKQPMEEIQRLTGLTKAEIDEAIQKHETNEAIKESTRALQIPLPKVVTEPETKEKMPSDPEVEMPSMLEVMALLKDIQKKLTLLLEKVE